MPIQVTLKPGPYKLDDSWCSKEDWEDMKEDGALEMFDDNPMDLWDSLPALLKLIAKVEWID
jgi:hypothetical protein